MNDFNYNFTLIFRRIIWEKTKILVVDMTPVIEALKIFIDIMKTENKCVYRIENQIDMLTNGDKIEWVMTTNQKYNCDIIEISFDNIKDYFKEKYDSYVDMLKERNIIDFPEEFFGKIFVCSILSCVEILKGDTIEKEEKVYGIFNFSNNGICNIIS